MYTVLCTLKIIGSSETLFWGIVVLVIIGVWIIIFTTAPAKSDNIVIVRTKTTEAENNEQKNSLNTPIKGKAQNTSMPTEAKKTEVKSTPTPKLDNEDIQKEKNIEIDIERIRLELTKTENPIIADIYKSFIINYKQDELRKYFFEKRNRLMNRQDCNVQEIQKAIREADIRYREIDANPCTIDMSRSIAETRISKYEKLSDAFKLLKKSGIYKASSENVIIYADKFYGLSVGKLEIPVFKIHKEICLYIYPNCIIINKSNGNFSVHKLNDLKIQCLPNLVETYDPPTDAQIISSRWLYANIDGTPDARRKDNRRVGKYRFADLEIKCEGYSQKITVSNYSAAEKFYDAFTNLRKPNKSTDSEKNINVNTSSSNNNITEHITKDYLDLCYDQAKSISYFITTLEMNDNVIQAVELNDELSMYDVIELGSHNSRIMGLIFFDLAKCFIKLGHDFDAKSKEILCPAILFGILNSKDFEIARNNLEYFYAKVVPNFAKFFSNISTISKNLTTANSKSNLIGLINESDRTPIIQYSSMLYRFASLVAKADNIITPQEAEYLKEIMYTNTKKTSQKITDNPKKKIELNNSINIHSATEELNNLIGMNSVKDEVNRLTNFIKVQKSRKEQDLKEIAVSYHCIFTGNPGTGKTTVARIMANIYKELGILSKGHLVETDRSGLVAEYVGQTAVKTNKIIDSALDGILFIDEAYSLVQGTGSDYGSEAIATLLKRMEDNRDRLVVILAGYSEDMKQFINANPGLQSRFNRYIHFEDYSTADLISIFKLYIKKSDYSLKQNAERVLQDTVFHAVANKDKNFGNARYIRNIFERTIENQATRIASQGRITKELMTTIEAVDIPK